MRAALVLFLAGLATSACAESRPAPVTVASVVRQACFTGSMERDAFETMAQADGWEPLRFNPPPGVSDWGTGFAKGNVKIMLTGSDAAASETRGGRQITKPAHRTCSVLITGPGAEWREEIESLAAEGGFAPSSAEGEGREWSKGGKELLRSTYNSATDILNITVYRIADASIRLLNTTNE